jgi:hypothetical protein
MIIAALVAASLAVPVAADAGVAWPPSGGGLRHMSTDQKLAVIRPLVETANQCIARKVTADPRYTTLAQAGEVSGLIVESVPSCVDAMRALIDAHDRLFGDGAGETYFMGPYLDALPSAVQRYLSGSQ